MREGLSYGLATLVEANLAGIGPLGLKLAVIALIAVSSFSAIDVFGDQSLAAEVRGSLASNKTGVRLIGILFIIGTTILLGTYFIFINGIYRISLPFLLILPAIVHAIRSSPSSPAMAGQARPVHPDEDGLMFLLLVQA